jgi:hypothetical protein
MSPVFSPNKRLRIRPYHPAALNSPISLIIYPACELSCLRRRICGTAGFFPDARLHHRSF